MKNNLKILVSSFLLVSFFLLNGCGEDPEQALSFKAFDEVEFGMEAMTSTLGSITDDAQVDDLGGNANSSRNFPTDINKDESVTEDGFCNRIASTQACELNGTISFKEIDFKGCQIPFTRAALFGNVTLNYTNTSCTLNSVGDEVNRVYSTEVIGPFGGKIYTSSSRHESFDRTSIGGGERITKTGAGWNLEILGKHHQIYGSSNSKIGDLSLKTTTPMVISGSLSKHNRTITSGSFDVYHNRAKVKVSYSPENLKWNSTCCHPISGKLHMVIVGGLRAGTATTVFTSCANARVTYENGDTENKTLSYCE